MSKPVLTPANKARKVTTALSMLALEYAMSDDPGERKYADPLHAAMRELPEESKAKLYDILVGA